MAMIQCPECGKEISSNATHCVGCGCVISVCPDCGSVAVGKPDSCSVCGHVFQREGKDSIEKEVATIETIQKKDQKVFSIVSNLIVVPILLAFLLIWLGIDKSIKWADNQNSFEQLASMESTYNKSLACVILGVILFAVGAVGIRVCEFSLTRWHYSWMKRKKFDYRDFLQGLGSEKNAGRNMRYFQSRMTKAAYMIHSTNGRIFEYAEIAFISAAALIFCVAGSVFAKEIMQAYFSSVIIGMEFKFQATPAFFVTLISFIPTWLANLICIQIIDKARVIRLRRAMLK